ncbi:hypothetical protein NSQ26_12235 [Bacillus sp. FSL W7-1360]
MKNDVALITIMHDPTGILYQPLVAAMPVLTTYPGAKYVALSEQTDRRVYDVLKAHGFTVCNIEKNGVAHARRKVAALAQSYGHDFYHYCDLDRLVTWALQSPDEWRCVHEKIVAHDYVLIGRTVHAFATHPDAWQETEAITNKIFSLALGREADVTAGSCGFSQRALMHIVQHSQAAMTDAEWPLLVCDVYGAAQVGAMNVEGLAYMAHNEDRTQGDVEAWCSRLRLAHVISETVRKWKERRGERV